MDTFRDKFRNFFKKDTNTPLSPPTPNIPPKKEDSLVQTFFVKVACGLTNGDSDINVSKEKESLDNLLGHSEVTALTTVLKEFMQKNLKNILDISEGEFLDELLKAKEDDIGKVVEGTLISFFYRENEEFVQLVQEYKRIFNGLKPYVQNNEELNTNWKQLEESTERVLKSGDLKEVNLLVISYKQFFMELLESVDKGGLGEIYKLLETSPLIDKDNKEDFSSRLKSLHQQKELDNQNKKLTNEDKQENGEVRKLEFLSIVGSMGNLVFGKVEQFSMASEKLWMHLFDHLPVHIKKLQQIEKELYSCKPEKQEKIKKRHKETFFELLKSARVYLCSSVKSGIIVEKGASILTSQLCKSKQEKLYKHYCGLRRIDDLGKIGQLTPLHKEEIEKSVLLPKVMDVAFDYLGKKGQEKLTDLSSVVKKEQAFGLELPSMPKMGEALSNIFSLPQKNNKKIKEACLPFMKDFVGIALSHLIDPKMAEKDRSLFETLILSLQAEAVQLLKELSLFNPEEQKPYEGLVRNCLERLKVGKASDLFYALDEESFNRLISSMALQLEKICKPLVQSGRLELISEAAQYLQQRIEYGIDRRRNKKKESITGIEEFSHKMLQGVHPLVISSVKEKGKAFLSTEQVEHLWHEPSISMMVAKAERIVEDTFLEIAEKGLEKIIEPKLLEKGYSFPQLLVLSLLSRTSPFLTEELKACGQDYAKLAKTLLGHLNIKEAKDLDVPEALFNYIVETLQKNLVRIVKPFEKQIAQEEFEWVGLIAVLVEDVLKQTPMKENSEEVQLSKHVGHFVKENFIDPLFNKQEEKIEENKPDPQETLNKILKEESKGIYQLFENGLASFFSRLLSMGENTKEALKNLMEMEKLCSEEVDEFDVSSLIKDKQLKEKQFSYTRHRELFYQLITKALGEGLSDKVKNKIYQLYCLMRQLEPIRAFSDNDKVCQSDMQQLRNEIIPDLLDVGLNFGGSQLKEMATKPFPFKKGDKEIKFQLPGMPESWKAFDNALSIQEKIEGLEEERPVFKQYLANCLGDIAHLWVNKMAKTDLLNQNQSLFDVMALSLLEESVSFLQEEGKDFLKQDEKKITPKELARALFKRLKIEKAEDLSLPTEGLFEKVLELVGAQLDLNLRKIPKLDLVIELSSVAQKMLKPGVLNNLVQDGSQNAQIAQQLLELKSKFLGKEKEVSEEEESSGDESIDEEKGFASVLKKCRKKYEKGALANAEKMVLQGVVQMLNNLVGETKGLAVENDKKGYILSVAADLLPTAVNILKGQGVTPLLEQKAFIEDVTKKLLSLSPDFKGFDENSAVFKEVSEFITKMYRENLLGNEWFSAVRNKNLQSLVEFKLIEKLDPSFKSKPLPELIKAFIDKKVKEQIEKIKNSVKGLGAKYGIPGRLLKALIYLLTFTIGLVLYVTLGQLLILSYHRTTRRLAKQAEAWLSANGVEERIETMIQQMVLQGIERLKSNAVSSKKQVETVFKNFSKEVCKGLLGRGLFSCVANGVVGKVRNGEIDKLEKVLEEDKDSRAKLGYVSKSLLHLGVSKGLSLLKV